MDNEICGRRLAKYFGKIISRNRSQKFNLGKSRKSLSRQLKCGEIFRYSGMPIGYINRIHWKQLAMAQPINVNSNDWRSHILCCLWSPQ